MPVKVSEAQDGTVDLEGVEIFATGTWHGDPYTEGDLDEMVRAHEDLRGQMDPPVKLGHAEGQKLLGQKNGHPALGWVKRLYREGPKLMADLTKVPRALYELIQKGAYRKRSAEVYWDYDAGTGKKYPRVLRAISILGADIPEVKTLQDLLALYDEEPGDWRVVTFDQGADGPPGGASGAGSEPNRKGDASMPDDDVKKYQEQIEAERKAREAAEKSARDAEEKVKTFESKVAAAEEEAAKLRAEKRATEIGAFIDQQKREGRILPAHEGLVKTFMEALDGDRVVKFSDGEKNLLDAFKAYVQGLPKLADFKEVSGGDKDGGDKDDFLAAVKEYQEKHQGVEYRDAVIAVAREKPDLYKAYHEKGADA